MEMTLGVGAPSKSSPGKAENEAFGIDKISWWLEVIDAKSHDQLPWTNKQFSREKVQISQVPDSPIYPESEKSVIGII